jgi:hypothetical protein
MKTLNYFSVIVLLIFLSSCNDSVEDSFREVESDLKIDIPISSFKSHDFTSENDHEFSGSNESNISNIVYQTNTVSSFYDLKPRNGSVVIISGILENYEVKSLSLSWNYKSIVNPNDIVNESIDLLSLDYSLSNGVFQVNIDNELGDLINKLDDPNGVIKFEISGTCNYNLNCIANLNIPLTIMSKIYTPRFELF